MKRFPTYLLAVLLFSLLTVFGCRTETDSAGSTSGASIVEPEVVNCRISANPDYLCPYQTFRAYTNTILEYCFQPLLMRDKTTLELKPILAKSVPKVMPITDGKFKGGYRVDFEILEEAMWDNGTPITGNDYLTTMKIIFNPAGTKYLPVYQDFLKWYGDVIVDEKNPKRFSVIAKNANYKILDNSSGPVLPAYAYDASGALEAFSFADFRDETKIKALKENPALKLVDSIFAARETTQDVENVIGSGPYKVSQWNQNVDVTLTKKENWWGEKVSKIRPGFVANAKSINFSIMPDETAVIAKLKNGEIDIAGRLSGTAYENLKTNALVAENYDFLVKETLTMNYLGLNNNSPKFSDARVRRAVSCLVDRKALINEVYQGHASPLYGPIAPQYSYAINEPNSSFNIENARALLKEAGWADSNSDGTVDKMVDGKRIEFVVDFLSTPTNATVQQMLLIMEADFKKAGIQLKARTLEPRELVAERRKGNFEIYTAGSTLVGDHYEVYQYWHTQSEMNYFGAGSAKMDKMIEELMAQTDEDLIHQGFLDFQKEMAQEMYMIFLTSPQERILLNKRLKGYETCLVRPNYKANYPHL